jgi:enterochelin esterase-like enzyme
VSGSFRSVALSRTMPYQVWLPPGYDADATARFSTLYLLHGGSGLNQEWVDYGVLVAAEQLMQARTIPRFLIALPQGDQEYWVDHVIDAATGANGEKWGTYVARDVVPEIDTHYRTIATADARAIGGLSMGAHAAMQLSLNFPGIWSVIGAHSPSLRPIGDAPTYLGTGSAEFAARDPLSLIRAKPELARAYVWWIDSGTLDPWVKQATALHDALTSLGIAHEWHSYEGDHSAAYWSAHVTDYLRYYGRVLH